MQHRQSASTVDNHMKGGELELAVTTAASRRRENELRVAIRVLDTLSAQESKPIIIRYSIGNRRKEQ